MTDSFALHTHIAPSVAGPALKPTQTQDSASALGDEPEDYTIKCICGFNEDDGNTVYCENCDTWQHTECYYIDENGVVPTNDDLKTKEHFCADCRERPLDRDGAIARQRDRRGELDPNDRKAKKPTAKSHKKKVRPSESTGPLINGWSHGYDSDLHDRTSRSPRDAHPPAKKHKSNHRVSNSMNIPPLTSIPTSHPHKRSVSIINSPSKLHTKLSTNETTKDPYSVDFLHLYDNDPGDAQMQTNLLNDIDITRDLGNWSNDVDELEKATNGLSPRHVFNRCDQSIASMALPHLTKECKEDQSALIHGRHPKWKFLTIDSFMPKDSVVAELKGKIGHMQRYIQDPANRWDYLRHPAPFVFFHPKLPIYIDTRSEGTACRYLRRSCDPNLSLKTFLENGSDYHFCFVAKQDLIAGSELTIGWVLDEHIRNYLSSRTNEDVKLEGDLDEDYVADWVGKVLAEFGGCACSHSDRCALAKYDRRTAGPAKGKNGYTGKHSPSHAGCTPNSRAGSEQDDKRSSSGSNPRSRDMTPIHNGAGESGFGAGIEISDREKRKIAALEKNFEQLENDKHQPAQKKKKRNSGGSMNNTPSASSSKQLGYAATTCSQPNTPGMPLKSHYTDASTSHRKSGSPSSKPSNPVGRPRHHTINARKQASQPSTPSIPSPLVRHNYINSSMQTEPEEDAWYRAPVLPTAATKPYMSLTKRLILRSQQDRAKLEEQRTASLEQSEGAELNGTGAPNTDKPGRTSENEDLEMHDIILGHPSRFGNSTTYGQSSRNTGHPQVDSTAAIEIRPPPPPPWPEAQQVRPINGYRANDLQVQLPLKPFFSSDSNSNTPFVETPVSTVPQSPSTYLPTAISSSLPYSLSSVVQPSPIKKKVSLGEYFASRRKGSQAATDVSAGGSLTTQLGMVKPPSLTNDISKDTDVSNSSAIDTPIGEERPPIE